MTRQHSLIHTIKQRYKQQQQIHSLWSWSTTAWLSFNSSSDFLSSNWRFSISSWVFFKASFMLSGSIRSKMMSTWVAVKNKWQITFKYQAQFPPQICTCVAQINREDTFLMLNEHCITQLYHEYLLDLLSTSMFKLCVQNGYNYNPIQWSDGNSIYQLQTQQLAKPHLHNDPRILCWQLLAHYKCNLWFNCTEDWHLQHTLTFMYLSLIILILSCQWIINNWRVCIREQLPLDHIQVKGPHKAKNCHWSHTRERPTQGTTYCMYLNTRQKVFPHSSYKNWGTTLQQSTKLSMSCMGIFLQIPDREGEVILHVW